VRDLERSRFPAIEGLLVERYCRQRDYIQTRYTPTAAEDLLATLSSPKKDLPLNPILLTFDDGYSDHFKTCSPSWTCEASEPASPTPARAVLERTRTAAKGDLPNGRS
jgi:hypothetical protein